jgi:hypothetical protein
MGWPVFPTNPDKTPATAHGFQDASTDEKVVTKLWAGRKNLGVALATGHGIAVLDVDPRNGGEDSFDKLMAARQLPPCPISLTGGGGRHYFLAVPPNTPSKKPLPGIDWKATGGYVVLPPSPHPSGKAYAWEESSRPDEVPIPPCPEWLLLAMNPPSKGPAKPLPEVVPEGQRHEAMISLAGSMRHRGASGEAIRAALEAENASGRFVPPADKDEIARIAADYAKKEAGPSLVRRPQPTTTDLSGKSVKWRTAAEVMPSVVSRMLDPKLRPIGIKTGFPDLDDITEGIHAGEVTLIGARTSMGKSTLALAIAAHAAKDHDVLFFSLEVNAAQVFQNVSVAQAKINSRNVRGQRKMTAEEGERFVGLAPDLAALRLNVVDDPMDVDTLARTVLEFGADKRPLVIVDYIQKVQPPFWAATSPRQEQVTYISHAISDLARLHNVPVLAMAQLNREVESRADHIPNIADLRESGALENDARTILLLHRPGVYDKDEPLSKAVVQVVKCSNGPTGQVELHFTPECMRFDSVVRAKTMQEFQESGEV